MADYICQILNKLQSVNKLYPILITVKLTNQIYSQKFDYNTMNLQCTKTIKSKNKTTQGYNIQQML